MHRFDVRKVIPVILLGLMMCVFPYTLGAQTQDLEIHYINVQQGQCTLIIGPDGTTILYDGGNEDKGGEVLGTGRKNRKNITPLNLLLQPCEFCLRSYK